jgi:FkbM family methyltransferase
MLLDKLRRHDIINGTPVVFEDLQCSNTVDVVVWELKTDYYGLEKIHLTPEDTVLDIGGNIGMFSIYVRKKFGCKVIAFEPVPLNYEQFKVNMKLNGLSESDIELHNVAITDVEGGKVKIYTSLFNTGASNEFEGCGNIESMCTTETIAKYITSDCKYLKIDCEGAEYKIIPTILDKLSDIKYIGIEYHRLAPTHDPIALHKLLRSSFKRPIFYRNYGEDYSSSVAGA